MHQAESSSSCFVYGLVIRFRLLSTPSPDDADLVEFGVQFLKLTAKKSS